MYPETKEAVRRAIQVCQTLWTLTPEEYEQLLLATDAIKLPKREEIVARLKERFRDEMIVEEEFDQLVDAELLEELKTRYSCAATNCGFEEGYGLAMLEYAAILSDLEDSYG